jgi:two-component system response regulator AtoC
MAFEKALVVDSDRGVRNFISSALKKKGIEVYTSDSLEKGKRLLEERHFDLLITENLELIPIFKTQSPLGTSFSFEKPLSIEALEKALDERQEKECPPTPLFLAHGEETKKLHSQVVEIAKSEANVFIFGETGTGKEVIAKILHQNSLRKENAFIKTNCAAIPETLLESEFFGHEKGAFTGAHQKRVGRFEMADKGTLLLDEVTEMPLYLQAKLLRAIEEKEFERVGGSDTVHVDVRFFSTSNRNPHQAVVEKHLREDLFYRLHVIPIYIPPLRERTEEILPLAHHFLEVFSKGKLRFSEESKEALLAYRWPGNVRELKNIIERTSVLAKEETISPSLLFNHHEKGLTLQEIEKRHLLENLNQQSSLHKSKISHDQKTGSPDPQPGRDRGL